MPPIFPVVRARGAQVLLALLVASQAGAEEPRGLLELYRQRDYFELRHRLSAAPPTAERRFLAAAVEHAFNRPAASNRLLDALGTEGGLSGELESERLRLLMENHLLLHDYRGALVAARRILDEPAAHPTALVAELTNTARLLEALEDTPRQSLERDSTVRLKLGLRRRVVGVGLGSERVEMGLDTGANYSVLMRSVARTAGLAIRPVGLRVATSTGLAIEADVAVAPIVDIGRASFRKVVFLVFPDQALTFSDGGRLDGLIGFPVLAALGEIRFRAGGIFEAPAKPPSRKRSNLALDGFELLVLAGFAKQDLVCRLDTGSDRTFFYSPFYRRFPERVEGLGALEEVEAEGLGGTRRLRAYRIPSLTLTVARADLRIAETTVYAEPLVEGETERLDCNLGVDLLDRFREYSINFVDTALVLGPPRR